MIDAPAFNHILQISFTFHIRTMSEQQEQHFLSDTPVQVAIQSLQNQVEQLKRIINAGS